MMPDRPAVPAPDSPLAVLREALAIAWPEGDHAEPNVYTEALAALGRVEAEIARLRDGLQRLSYCVMHGWTEPAFVRGKLHDEAVSIARALLAEDGAALTAGGQPEERDGTDGATAPVRQRGTAVPPPPDSPAASAEGRYTACMEALSAAEAEAQKLREERDAREALAEDTPAESEWFIPEGDRACGVVHRLARATCMKRRGHEGSHATPQGTWIDGPWCEYPADSQEDKT